MGKRSEVSLTNRVCAAATGQASRYNLWDKELPGFGLRVEPSGTKTFFAKYRTQGGGRRAEQRIVTIGRYGVVTPELARREAKAMLGGVATGKDPGADIQTRRRRMKMSELVDLYEKKGCFIQRGKRQGFPMKPQTKAYTLSRLRHHVVPLLGRKVVADLTPGDIEDFYRSVANGETAKKEKLGPRKVVNVRGGDGAARKVVRDLSAVFSFAMRHQVIDRNPCEKAAVRKTDNQNERFLTLDEVTLLGRAIDALADEGTNTKALDIMRLWALTGCRRSEIASLRWEEVDFEHGCLRFGDTKTGKSVRPLGIAAIALLRGIEREDDAVYVFPAETGEGYFQGYKTPWKHAVEKAGLENVTPHTLRHTMGSTTISSGEAMAFAGAILGHANPRSTAIYAHVQHLPARQVADRVSETIAAALAGAQAVASNPDRERVASDEQLLTGLAGVLTKEGADAERLRALLKMFVE